VRLVFHPEARAELLAAAVWYDERRAGLGDDLVAEVNAVLEEFAAAPMRFPLWPGLSDATPAIRRVVLSRFPYVVACEVHPSHVLVLAVAHGRRRPLYWLTRSPESRHPRDRAE
jgi:hypothetical protein